MRPTFNLNIDKINETMDALDMTQSQIATHLGVNQSWISQLLSPTNRQFRGRCGTQTAKRLAGALGGIAVEEILLPNGKKPAKALSKTKEFRIWIRPSKNPDGSSRKGYWRTLTAATRRGLAEGGHIGGSRRAKNFAAKLHSKTRTTASTSADPRKGMVHAYVPNPSPPLGMAGNGVDKYIGPAKRILVVGKDQHSVLDLNEVNIFFIR